MKVNDHIQQGLLRSVHTAVIVCCNSLCFHIGLGQFFEVMHCTTGKNLISYALLLVHTFIE